MTFLTIHMTRIKRLAHPEPLPEISYSEAVSWFSGWWCGIAIGVVCGAGIAALVLQYMGRL